MHDQTETLGKISDKASTIMTDIKRADKLLRTFRRALAADKIIWVLVGLVVIGIVVVIIVASINPEVKQNLNIPDIVVPDTKKIKDGINQALADMGIVATDSLSGNAVASSPSGATRRRLRFSR